MVKSPMPTIVVRPKQGSALDPHHAGIGPLDAYIPKQMQTASEWRRGKESRRVFPFIDTAPRAARPVMVFGLIAVNTVVFVWLWSLSRSGLNDVLVHYAL